MYQQQQRGIISITVGQSIRSSTDFDKRLHSYVVAIIIAASYYLPRLPQLAWCAARNCVKLLDTHYLKGAKHASPRILESKPGSLHYPFIIVRKVVLSISAVMESIFKVSRGEWPSITMLKVAFSSFKAHGVEESKAGNNGEQEQKDDTTTFESPTTPTLTEENKEVIEKNKSDREGEIEQERHYSKRRERRNIASHYCGQMATPKAKESDRKSQQNVEASKRRNQIEMKEQNQERQTSVFQSSSEAYRSRNQGSQKGVVKNQPPPQRFEQRQRCGRGGSGPSRTTSQRPDRDRPQERPRPPPLMPPPPPPYTPNPLPNHSAIYGHSTSGVTPLGFPQGPSASAYCGSPQFNSLGRNSQQGSIDHEIRRREEELKMLRTEKLVREINEKQAEVAQLTQKLAEQGLLSTPVTTPVGTSAGPSFQGRDNERSRGNSSLPKTSFEGHRGRGRERGRGRGESRGRNSNPSKMAPFPPEDKKGNIF